MIADSIGAFQYDTWLLNRVVAVGVKIFGKNRKCKETDFSGLLPILDDMTKCNCKSK